MAIIYSESSVYNYTFEDELKFDEGLLLERGFLAFLLPMKKDETYYLKIRIFLSCKNSQERLCRYQAVYPGVNFPTITHSAQDAFRKIMKKLAPWSSLILDKLSDSCKSDLRRKSHNKDSTNLNSLASLRYPIIRENLVEFMTVIHTLWKNGEFSKKPN